MADEVVFLWLDGPDSDGAAPATQKEWDAIDTICVNRGWMSLSRAFTRVLVAKREDEIIAFIVLQAIPHVEPLYVAATERGTGLAEELSDRMVKYLTDVKARGWLCVADSPFAEQLCKDRGMKKLKSPVYSTL
jgi:hypothetical protein